MCPGKTGKQTCRLVATVNNQADFRSPEAQTAHPHQSETGIFRSTTPLQDGVRNPNKWKAMNPIRRRNTQTFSAEIALHIQYVCSRRKRAMTGRRDKYQPRQKLCHLWEYYLNLMQSVAQSLANEFNTALESCALTRLLKHADKANITITGRRILMIEAKCNKMGALIMLSNLDHFD